MEKKSFTEETREAVVQEAEGRGLILAEEHNHHDGDFLIFIDSDEKAARESAQAEDALAESDKGMARGVEDLYQALIAKSLILEADLPDEFRDKIQARAALRASLKVS